MKLILVKQCFHYNKMVYSYCDMIDLFIYLWYIKRSIVDIVDTLVD